MFLRFAIIEKKINKVLKTLSMGHANFKIELLENRMNEFQNEITNSKPMMKKLEEYT